MSDMTPTPHTEADTEKTIKYAYGIYIVYFAALMLPIFLAGFFPPMFTPAFAGVALIFAHVFRSGAKGAVKSYYQYAISTYWIGVVYFCIYFGLCFVIAYYHPLDYLGMGPAASSMNPILSDILMAALKVWFIARCAKGFKYLSLRKPISHPKTWLV